MTELVTHATGLARNGLKRTDVLMNSEHIIDNVCGWREEDYDGYNDYYVNPEFVRSETTRKRVDDQQDKQLNDFELWK